MADERKTLDDLNQVTTLQATDILLSKRPGGATSKATVQQLIDLAEPAAITHSAAEKAAAADNDEFGIADSADSFKLKKLKLQNLIASIFTATRKIANAGFVASSFKWWNSAGTFYHSVIAAPTGNRTITIPDRNVDLTGVSSAAPFVSAQQVFSNSSAVTVAHGLSGKPSKVRARIVCLTSEGGYAVGDDIHLATGYGFADSSTYSLALSANPTTVVLAVVLIRLPSKTASATFTVTPANWRVVLEAEL